MKVDLYKVGKRLLKYYLIYHLVYDLYLLGQVAYWYFSESKLNVKSMNQLNRELNQR